MNHNRKAAAIAKYSETPEADLKAALTSDEKNYTPEEVEEIYQAFYQTIVKASQAHEYDPKNPNTHLDLSAFNYKELQGDSFKAYNGLMDSLLLEQSYDFILLKVSPVLKERFEGLPGSPKDFVGITIKNDTPEHTTRIPVKFARDHNAQVLNDHGRVNGKMYLLKK